MSKSVEVKWFSVEQITGIVVASSLHAVSIKPTIKPLTRYLMNKQPFSLPRFANS